MAQFNQQLSQTSPKQVEELRHFYPVIGENQNRTVQYIINSISPEDQHLRGQPILVSSDQFMLIENQGQVILDQSQLSYQTTPQFILQDANTIVENRAQHHQIYYMKKEINQQTCNQSIPIVLNNLSNSQLKNQILNSSVKAQQMPPPPPPPLNPQLPVQNRTLTPLNLLTHEGKQIGLNQSPKPLRPEMSMKSFSLPVPVLTQIIPKKTVTTKNVQTITRRENSNRQFSIPDTSKRNVEKDEHQNQKCLTLSDGTVFSEAELKRIITEKQKIEMQNKVKGNIIPRASKPTGHGPIHKTITVNTQQQVDYKMQQFTNQQQQQQQQQQQNVRQEQYVKTMQTKQNLQQQQQQQHLVKSVGSFQNQQKNINQHLNKINQIPAPNIHQKHQQHQPQQQQQQQQQQTVSTYVQPQYIIQPPSQRQTRKVCPLPPYVPSAQIQQIIENTPVSDEHNDSIRMLVLLENGEQRLITFTLPKEVCTIQEILEQVGVPFQKDTRIELTETNSNGINYFATVGDIDKLRNQTTQQQGENKKNEDYKSMQRRPQKSPPTTSPELPKELPKFIPGKCAVCNHCGYLSENFYRCLRCGYKLPEDIKSMPMSTDSERKSMMLHNQNLTTTNSRKECENSGGKIGITINTKPSPIKNKKPKTKSIDPETVILTLSSDDEEDHKSIEKTSPITENIFKRIADSSSVSLTSIRKEPSVSDIEKTNYQRKPTDNIVMVNNGPEFTLEVICRMLRIGSYKFCPIESRILLTNNGIMLQAPTIKDQTELTTICTEKNGIIKILANFQKVVPVLFYYFSPAAAKTIRDKLGMTEGSEPYYNPLSEDESHKRITIFLNCANEEIRLNMRKIYPANILEELTNTEANELLCKTCPKEVGSVVAGLGYLQIKQLLIYPPGKGGLSINTEDYLCLGRDQFLNDVIIDFYLKYLVLNLTPEQQKKVYVFSTFFYKRLTTKPAKSTRKSHPIEHDSNLTPAQKRHARVEKWTKSVNLFEKDYIIIPINENCHWFLAIICFPALSGCYTFDGKSIKVEKRKRKCIKIKREDKPIACEDIEANSDKDEAEADDSELESGEEDDLEEIINEKDVGQPIKQPCILIFDSLAGTGRARVVATLRDYLSSEFKAKMGLEKKFTKDIIKGCCPKVPQQTNFTDCGLYLLQYVEHFLNEPIKDYRLPIKQLKNWFDESVVTKKREDIANLIKELMLKYNRDVDDLPDLTLPTRNGKILSPIAAMEECAEEETFEEEEEDEEEEEEEEIDGNDVETFQMKISNYLQNRNSEENREEEEEEEEREEEQATEKTKNSSNLLSEELIFPLQSTLQESDALKEDVNTLASKTISNRDTLSYLKAKRINRHKNIDHNSDPKKMKTTN